MKQVIIIFIAFSQVLFAQNKELPRYFIDSKVEKATVFLSGAQVYRSAKVSVKAGKNVYVLGGLSPFLNQQTLQVKGTGDFTILSAVQRMNFLNELNSTKRIDIISAKMDSIQQKIEEENINAVVLKSEEELLDKMQTVSQIQKPISPAEITEALAYRQQKLTELKLKSLKIQAQILKLKEDYNVFYKQLVAENVKQNMSTSEVSVTITTTKEMETTLEISYFVPNAGWTPFYDFRVKDISQPMQLTHKANVFQQTGEDWNEIQLTLSNANPYQDNTIPQLETWRLEDIYVSDNRKLMKATSEDTDNDGIPDLFDKNADTPNNVTVNGSGKVLDSDNDGVADILDEEKYTPRGQPVDAKGVAKTHTSILKTSKDAKTEAYYLAKQSEKSLDIPITQKAQQTVFSYEINVPYTIIADGKYNIVEIKNVEVPVLYQYYAVPKLQKEAFLLALIKNWETYDLLEGEANLFFEGTYIGKSYLHLQNAGDTLQISLGIDKAVTVNRVKQKETDSRQFIGNQQTANRFFEISARNNKKQAIEILITDQFPQSMQADIVVENREYNGGKLDEKTGKVQWLIPVKSGEEQKVKLKYSVKFPKNINIDLE